MFASAFIHHILSFSPCVRATMCVKVCSLQLVAGIAQSALQRAANRKHWERDTGNTVGLVEGSVKPPQL